MDQLELQAVPRQILGKKVRFLRRQGITPAHLFGPDVSSVALQCDTAHLQHVLARAGKTRLINLKFNDSKQNVVVREVQKDTLTGQLLHVDLYQVRMAERIRVEVPVVLVGTAPALRSKDNALEQELNSLMVECLPDQIPAAIDIDVSPLTDADQAIRVKDIKLGKEISILNDPEVVVARISVRAPEEVKKPVAEEEAKAPEEAEPTEEEKGE